MLPNHFEKNPSFQVASKAMEVLYLGGQISQALKLSHQISDPVTRSCQFYNIARSLAEQGKMELALKVAAAAYESLKYIDDEGDRISQKEFLLSQLPFYKPLQVSFLSQVYKK